MPEFLLWHDTGNKTYLKRGVVMKDVDNFLLRQAYFWLFEIKVNGIRKFDTISVGKKTNKTRETLDWLQGVIDTANAPFIERSRAIVEKQMADLFQNDPQLRGLSEGFSVKIHASVEFEYQELVDTFKSDHNLFRDLGVWVTNVIGIPYLKSLPDTHHYLVDIQKLNDLGSEINRWSYEKNGDERVRFIKKANFIIGWLNLLSEAGIERDKISRKAFEKWRTKKQDSSEMFEES